MTPASLQLSDGLIPVAGVVDSDEIKGRWLRLSQLFWALRRVSRDQLHFMKVDKTRMN